MDKEGTHVVCWARSAAAARRAASAALGGQPTRLGAAAVSGAARRHQLCSTGFLHQLCSFLVTLLPNFRGA